MTKLGVGEAHRGSPACQGAGPQQVVQHCLADAQFTLGIEQQVHKLLLASAFQLHAANVISMAAADDIGYSGMKSELQFKVEWQVISADSETFAECHVNTRQ